MATRKKTTSRKRKTAHKKTTHKKTTHKKTARKTTRRKRHYPSVKKHGKTPAARWKYFVYREEVDALKKRFFG